jgi:hypothetical protein
MSSYSNLKQYKNFMTKCHILNERSGTCVSGVEFNSSILLSALSTCPKQEKIYFYVSLLPSRKMTVSVFGKYMYNYAGKIKYQFGEI